MEAVRRSEVVHPATTRPVIGARGTASGGNGFGSAFRRIYIYPRILQQSLYDHKINLYVIHHQDMRIGSGKTFPVDIHLTLKALRFSLKLTYGGRIHNALIKIKPELRSLSVLASQMQAAPHQLHIFVRDGKTQTGPLDPPVMLLVEPLEGFPQVFPVFFLYPDTGILYRNTKAYILIIGQQLLDTESDTSFFRILHGICQKIGKDLTQTYVITPKDRRYTAVDKIIDAEVFLCRAELDHIQDITYQRRYLIFDRYYLKLAGLYL